MENNDFTLEKELELQKELQFNLESTKLSEVIELINKEILVYINKRKNVANYIEDYRKKTIEEYRDDEDKLIEYFDHERYVKEESFKNIDSRLKELNILSVSPYFGRIDYNEADEDDKEIIYVGRFGMTPEGEYEPVIVDWRAPVSALFYANRLGENSYNAPAGKITVDIKLKRQFVIKKSKLVGLFDSALDVKDDILQLVLSSNTSAKLRDIIMTIQEEQDQLIRQPKDKTIVVDGVAGSGKTTIALHRISYLLYNHRDTLQDKVLILGPNSIFMEYIGTVLPSLGEVGVKQTTFRNFAMKILDTPAVMDFKTYMEKILIGDKEFIADVRKKTSLDYLNTLNEFTNKLDLSLYSYKDVNYFDKTAVDIKEIDKLFNFHYKSMPLFRRSKKIKRIIFTKLKELRDEKVRTIKREYKEKIRSMSKAELELFETSLNMARINNIRDAVSEVMRAKKEMSWLNNPSCIELYNEINDNKELTQDDLAPILYLKLKLEGLALKEEIKHVVIDEAQDYSPIQFLVIKELTRCSSLTIVGDSNQRLIPLDGTTPMLSLHKILPSLNIEYFNLFKSYRSTKEIMEYANEFIDDNRIVPLVRSGEKVIEKNFNNEDTLVEDIDKALQTLKAKEYENIAVLCRDMEETEKIGKSLKSKDYIKLLDEEDLIYNGGTVVIPSYFAKGLEFDAVILIHGKEKLSDSKLNYVMATRALHELVVYKI
ncbi:HelD family protein [Candidatus Clostridium radicumherbarum]|uniref:DNA 3'-5' helicase n=1 Tax=Candidatus Clostridium radicumherbarum TaxID=3381662 RepID=A0ABW8TM16_9CLOT